MQINKTNNVHDNITTLNKPPHVFLKDITQICDIYYLTFKNPTYENYFS